MSNLPQAQALPAQEELRLRRLNRASILLLGIATLATGLYVRAEIEGRHHHAQYRLAHPEWQ